ncbi:hypothetical protein HK098_008241 [Nowakowskiella sp. JEL0407]|nr:hypothetical protein HK098_008241 [Nowakowskiella sp. JEL0407]
MANACRYCCPSGICTLTLFFETWISELHNFNAWTSFKSALASIPDSEINDLGGDSVIQVHSDKSAWKLHIFDTVAVRSSCPDEDLGGYETILGVKKETLSTAILDAFISCLDARFVLYKIAHSFTALTPSLAVVIQQQVSCNVAGVAFSVNPITNCNTKVFVNSNFGLGESVVAGIVSPDRWTVQKKTGKVLTKTVGEKGMYVRLKKEGGIEYVEADFQMSSQFSLSDEMISKVAHQVEKIEKLYHTAIDIDFGIANNELFILQARPVTSSLPFPLRSSEEWTKNPHVLWDVTLGLHTFVHYFTGSLLDLPSPSTAFPVLILPEIGRLYFDISAIYNSVTKSVVSNLPLMDPIATDVLKDLDLPLTNPASINKLLLGLKVLFRVPIFKMISTVVRTNWNSEESHRNAHIALDREIEKIKLIKRKPGELLAWVVNLIDETGDIFSTELLPRLVVWRNLHGKMDELLNKHHLLNVAEGKLNYQNLEKSSPGNVTVEMGMELSKIAKLIADLGSIRGSALSVDELDDALHGRSTVVLSDEIKHRWEEFISKYGHRGDEEFDFSTPR